MTPDEMLRKYLDSEEVARRVEVAIRAAFAKAWAAHLDREFAKVNAAVREWTNPDLGAKWEGAMQTDRNGHPLEKMDFVKVFPISGDRPVVLGRILGLCDEVAGKGTKADPFRARTTYRIVCGVRAEIGKEARGSAVVVERWKDGVEFIGADRVNAAFVAFGVWIP